MKLAQEIATWSKHPNTKVGCVAIDDEQRQVAGGFNGLPRGCNDTRILDQSKSVSGTVHAEANTVAMAARQVMKGTTVYVSEPPCAQCAALLIQAGVKKVVYRVNLNLSQKWAESVNEGLNLLQEAGVELEGVYQTICDEKP